MATPVSKHSMKASVRLGVPAISISPMSLSFEYIDTDGSAVAQELVVSNSGEAVSVLKWSAAAAVGSDMTITASPSSGELEPGSTAVVKVLVESGKSVGAYAGILTFIDTGVGTTVTAVDVEVTLTVEAAAVPATCPWAAGWPTAPSYTYAGGINAAAIVNWGAGDTPIANVASYLASYPVLPVSGGGSCIWRTNGPTISGLSYVIEVVLERVGSGWSCRFHVRYYDSYIGGAIFRKLTGATPAGTYAFENSSAIWGTLGSVILSA